MPAEQFDPLEVLSREKTAALLNISAATLDTWRSTRRYPLPFVKIGRRVGYLRRDVANFLEARTVGVNEGNNLRLAVG